MRKVEIIPAILPKDYFELESKITSIQNSVDIVQIDICDGQFTPNATWPYKRADESWQAIINQEQGMPGWEKIDYELDLMVNRPEEVVSDWISAGISRIILHAEAKGSLGDAISKINGAVEIGLALNVETALSVAYLFRDKIGTIQVMGIDHIGFQGQAFNENVISKIKEIKKEFPDLTVAVDGGVSLDNIRELIEAGADRLIIGSAIFGQENIIEAINRFKHIASI